MKDIYDGPESGLYTVNPYTIHENRIYFAASDAAHGYELWQSDGTDGGTNRISDIKSGLESSLLVNEIISVGGKLYFQADDLVEGNGHGKEMWVWDGGDPHLVEDINPGTRGSTITYETPYDGNLFFVVDNHLEYGIEIWGVTSQKADLISDHVPGAAHNGITGLTVFEGAIHFLAFNPDTQKYALFKTYGIPDTEHILVHGEDDYDFNPNLHQNGIVGDKLFFGGTDENGEQLWKLQDGNASLVKIINPSGPSGIFGPYMRGFKDKLYFQAWDEDHGPEMWVSDGTGGGTYLLKDIREGDDGSDPVPTIIYNDELYLTANGGQGTELWKTDGTEDGTVIVKDINATGFSNPARFVEYDSLLFFIADDGVHGRELWVTDGTEVNTKMIIDFNPGSGNGVYSIIPYNNELFVAADEGTKGIELYQYNALIVACPQEKLFTLGEDKTITTDEIVELNGPENATSYEWSTGASTSAILIVEGDILGPGDHEIWLKATYDNGCTSADTIKIIVEITCPDGKQFTLGEDVTITILEDVTLSGPDNASAYEWSTGETLQTVNIVGDEIGLGVHDIWLNVTDENNCTSADTVQVTVEEVVTGLSSENDTGFVNLYPNPVDHTLQFSNEHRISSVTIFDITGRKLIQSEFNGFTPPTVSVNHLKRGILLVHVTLVNGQKNVFKLIKER